MMHLGELDRETLAFYAGDIRSFMEDARKNGVYEIYPMILNPYLANQ
jgi:hypothetical protein